jgi:hypothetical protein
MPLGLIVLSIYSCECAVRPYPPLPPRSAAPLGRPWDDAHMECVCIYVSIQAAFLSRPSINQCPTSANFEVTVSEYA